MKGNVHECSQERIIYRSFKQLDERQLHQDLDQVPFHVAHIFEDMSDVYWAHEKLLGEIVDEHIPLKERFTRKSKAPMNGLRKVINY